MGPEEIFPADFGEQMSKAFNQLRGVIDDTMAERYEYALVPWPEVNDLARQGWLVMPITVNETLAYPVFVMSRKLGVSDEAAEILRQPATAKCPICDTEFFPERQPE
jgi:hypothetical protein